MPKRSRVVRLSEANYMRLMKEIEDFCFAVLEGKADAGEFYNPDPINPRTRGVSVDVFIGMLLDARASHRARRRKARAPKGSVTE